MIHRAFRYRLYPTDEQAERMAATAHACRFVFNLALEQRRDFWRQAKRHGVALNAFTQGREVTQLRKEVPWLAAVHGTALAYALRDLDAAFRRFFTGAGFPRFRSRDRGLSFRHKGEEVAVRRLNDRWSLVRVPKLGWVKFRDTRPVKGKTISVAFARDALGWHVAFACEIEHEARPAALPAVGIDRGVANTLALSTGELLSTPCTVKLERRKKRAQRILSRRKRGSKRYAKQRARVARLCARIARIRGHWQHEVSTDIAGRFGAVALENLNTQGMTQGRRGVARTILEQGWRGFETKLAYKIEERGGALTKVHPAYSSQTCSSCGTVDKASRKSQSRFVCQHCGFAAHADVNAANVILRRSAPVVEERGYASVEARTEQALAA